MNRKKFQEYISKPWPKKIIRAKGITYFNDEKEMSEKIRKLAIKYNINFLVFAKVLFLSINFS